MFLSTADEKDEAKQIHGEWTRVFLEFSFGDNLDCRKFQVVSVFSFCV